MPHAWLCRAALDQTALMTSIQVKCAIFHRRTCCHRGVLWLVQMGTTHNGTAKLDSRHQLWMWLLHKWQGALGDRSNVCQTDAAMIPNCVWVMLKGCLLTPERFSGPAVATQPNFISFWGKEQLLCWREVDLCVCCFINVEISKWGILWGQVAEQSTFNCSHRSVLWNCPSASAVRMNWAIQRKFWRLKLASDFTHWHKN